MLKRSLFFLPEPPLPLDLLPELFNLPLETVRFIENVLPGFLAFLKVPPCFLFRLKSFALLLLLFANCIFALPWKGLARLNIVGFLNLPLGAPVLAAHFDLDEVTSFGLPHDIKMKMIRRKLKYFFKIHPFGFRQITKSVPQLTLFVHHQQRNFRSKRKFVGDRFGKNSLEQTMLTC